MSTPEVRFDVQPTVSNHFAWLRTQMGLQRTLMAAVRTSVSLIGFGFTVAEFFQRLEGEASVGRHFTNPEIPRNLGMVLIGAGVLSLVVFTYQYHAASKYLHGEPYTSLAGIGRRPMHASTYFAALVVMFIGVAAFVSVFARF
jgi:putative membrane protein